MEKSDFSALVDLKFAFKDKEKGFNDSQASNFWISFYFFQKLDLKCVCGQKNNM